MKPHIKQANPLTEAWREIARLSKRLTHLTALVANAHVQTQPAVRLDVDMLSINALRCRELTIEDQFGNDRAWIGVERTTGNTVLHLYPARGVAVVMLTADELGGRIEVQSFDGRKLATFTERGLLEVDATEVAVTRHDERRR